MKTIRKLKGLLLLVVSMCVGVVTYGQTHVYITGSDTGNTNNPAPPSGTPTANKVTTFKAAIDRANAVGGNVVIHLRTNSLNETTTCAAIKANVNVQVINDTPARKAIRLDPAAYTSNHRWIAVNGTLTLGGDGCTSVLIIRGQNSDPYYYPTNTSGTNGDEIPPIVLVKVHNGTLNIENNCELCYGKVNVWLSNTPATVNLKDGAVIHSALDMNVNITQGTFNMQGGYIMGHYFTGGNTVPNLGNNPIMDKETFLTNHFTKNGTMDYYLDQYDVEEVLQEYYPIDETDELSKINGATGVYIHETKDASGNHLAKFNMSGGSICGIYGDGKRAVIIEGSSSDFVYATNESGSIYKLHGNAIYNNGGECRISGGNIYANRTNGSGGGIMNTCWDFDKENVNENYEHTHLYMSGGEISYCSGGTGGALRIEYGITVELSGDARLTHCVSVPRELLNDTTNRQTGGGGAIRIVSSKLTMTDNAEISWCHSPTISEAMNGGGIGAVWEPGFGHVYTTVNLHGGSIHHNRSESYGGGMTATDKGNENVIGGISVSIKGCSIHDNIAATNGGGIYVGGNSSVYIDQAEGTATKALIYNNTALKGGGVFVSSSHMQAGGVRGLLDASNCSFYNNSAVDGGGIYTEYADVNVHGGVNIYNHNVTGNGAGVCIAREADYYQDGGLVGNTTIATANHAQGKGGGFYVKDGNVVIDGGEVAFNSSSTNGGGGYVDGGTFTFYGGDIYDNEAVNGGGMYVNIGWCWLAGGYIHGNTASQRGGGVYMNGGDFIHSSGEIGKYYSNPNEAQYGAGVYMNGGDYTMSGGYINGNAASINGGGVFMNQGDFTMKGGSIGMGTTTYRNTAQDGAGVYMNGGTFTMKNGYLRGNYASGNGGGVYSTGGTCAVTGGYIGQNANNHNEAVDGGGIYSAGGLITLDNDSTAVHINYNVASNNGGGIYTTSGGNIQLNKTNSSRVVEINRNSATNWGGGIYAAGTVTVNGGTVQLNHAGSYGGGVYVNGGSYSMTGGIVGGTTSQGNYTDGSSSGDHGAGIAVMSGTANISGGAISGNHTTAAGHGGGIYMFGGTCTLSSGATIGGENANYANSALLGGGIHSAGGIITVKGGVIGYNIASQDGGGIYTNGESGVVNVEASNSKATSSSIEYNTAVNGGGIYANRGTVNFSDGSIHHNYASEAGGGIFVNFNNSTDFGILNLKGNAVLALNRVPSGKKGGGVYLLGRVFVGETTSGGTGSSVTAETNYASDTELTEAGITDANRNNIYLPDPQVRDDHSGLITVNKGGIGLTSSVGFSVPRNRVPVIYCEYSAANTPHTGDPSSYDYLDQFTTGPASHQYQNVLFDDTRHYISVHYTIYPRDRFDYDHVYLFGFWPEAVTEKPAGFSFDNIDSEEDLAWLITYVNGRTNNSGVVELPPHTLQDTVVNLNADLNMEQYGWVPIGTMANPYKPSLHNKPFMGTFEGNGHTIEGINGMVYKDHYAYGLFGYTADADIQNLFIKDAEFYIENNDTLVVGGLIGNLASSGTIGNVEVSSLLVAVSPKTTMGGLVGRQEAGTVHSAIGIADMRGGLMGGLVGKLLGGNLYNSFSNVKFTPIANHTQYMGGLVAENSGTVENCYVRLRGEVPTSDYYGWLVGQNNTGGNVNFCYSKADEKYVATTGGNFGGKLKGCGYYADDTEVPYAYRRRDNQVMIASASVNNNGTANPHKPAEYDPDVVDPRVIAAGESDKEMKLWLNRWVTAKNAESGTHPTYTYWKRPTTKVINDDLPVLRMPVAEAVAATTGDPYLYYGPVNTLIGTYTAASQAIWLYKDKDGVADNSSSYAKLYIDEGLVAIPADDAAVKAYVGVTLRNTAGKNGANPTFGDGTPDFTDWHMFSSPLVAAPLGIDYHDDNTAYHGEMSNYDYYGHAGMPYYRFFNDEDMRGFFPSYRYGESYPLVDNELSAGNYYHEWDFYTYYEPEYHWINFKRNSNDHWHENAHDYQIEYDNEDSLTQGRGYLLATREETFLQCHGELTNDEVYIDATVDGLFSPGYNFLGNPYLAYLDFNAFARANEWIWGSYNKAAYAVIDEVSGGTGGYVYYAPEASVNPALATRFIAPMQGFMVLAVESDEVEFNTGMRTVTDTIGDSHFRGGDVLAYPLVNLYAHDDNGNRDVTTVELGRPDQGGAKLMRELKMAKCHVYCHYNDQDWAIAFTKPGLTEAAIRFEAYSDGEFTMKWNTQNGDFSYLHLIDNLTGADIDCLTATEYRFTASTSDYRSRFRLVFGYTGVEEEMGEEQNVSFAFQSGDELVITGEGTFTMFDVTGRAVMKTETHGTQTAAPLPNVAAGVYLLQLDSANGTKVQKIVIK